MNKKFLTMMLLSTIALSTTTVVYAADTATEMTSSAGIGFFEVNKPGPGPFEGNLALAYVPMNFDFGNNDVTNLSGTKNQKTYSQQIDPSKTQYVAVSDDRDDKTKNWELTADLDDFTDTSNKANTLAAAELSFQVGKQQRYNINIKESDKHGYASPVITNPGAVTDFSNGESNYYVGSATNITLVAGSSTAVPVIKYTSPSQNINDTLAVASTISNVELKVKDHSNVTNKKFTSTVNWRLSVTP